MSGTPVLNQDPRLRAMILPLFRINPQALDDRPFGLGTVFRIDPWGNCATAFHVIEDMLVADGDKARVKDDVSVCALEFEGIAYGSPPLPKDAWRPLAEFYSEMGLETSPLLHVPKKIRNLTELARLTIPRSARPGDTPFLPLAMSRSTPAIGDIVTGYGFAGLDVDQHGRGEDRPIQQYLYESSGEVIEVLPADPASTMPWPRFRVAAEWPSGMSGGPVIDKNGNVVGIISRSWTGEADSTATHFAGWNIGPRTFPTLDASNPGSFRCFAAIDDEDDIRFLGLNLHEAEKFAEKSDCRVRFVTCNPTNGDWIQLADNAPISEVVA